MSEPTAYEIAEAWDDLNDAVKDYRRTHCGWSEEQRIEVRFADFARLVQRVPKEEER